MVCSSRYDERGSWSHTWTAGSPDGPCSRGEREARAQVVAVDSLRAGGLGLGWNREGPALSRHWCPGGLTLALNSKCSTYIAYYSFELLFSADVVGFAMMDYVELKVDAPWVPTKERRLDGLSLRRGPNVVAFGDGVTLEVRLVDPTPFDSVKALFEQVERQRGPGRVVLVAGSIPIAWRSRLRSAGVSFLDVSGVAEFDWPRIRVSANRLDGSVQRRTSPIPLQKNHALVVQELLIIASRSHSPTINELARGTQVSPSSVSRAIARLATHGLVDKQRIGREVRVKVTDPVELASRLAERTAWGHTDVLFAYRWGRTPWDVAARLSSDAAKQGVRLVVSGRAGAAFLGALGTSSPALIRCWVDSPQLPLADIPAALGLEAAREEEANVAIAVDPWRIGVHRSDAARLDQWTATVSHPLRVWCDLHSEQRGTEFAAQMWGGISHGW